jgi:hypothetical protein
MTLKLLRELFWIAAFVAIAKGEGVLCIGFIVATYRCDVALGDAV